MGASSVSYQWQIQPAPTLSFQCSNDCWVSIQQRCIFFSIDSLLTVQFLQEWEHTKTWGSQLYDVTYTIKGSNPRVLDSTTDKGRQKACDAFCSNQSFRFKFSCTSRILSGYLSSILQESIISAFFTTSNGRPSSRVNMGRRVRVAGPDWETECEWIRDPYGAREYSLIWRHCQWKCQTIQNIEMNRLVHLFDKVIICFSLILHCW